MTSRLCSASHGLLWFVFASWHALQSTNYLPPLTCILMVITNHINIYSNSLCIHLYIYISCLAWHYTCIMVLHIKATLYILNEMMFNSLPILRHLCVQDDRIFYLYVAGFSLADANSPRSWLVAGVTRFHIARSKQQQTIWNISSVERCSAVKLSSLKPKIPANFFPSRRHFSRFFCAHNVKST